MGRWMDAPSTATWLLIAFGMGAAGLVLVAHATVQARLLRRRIAQGLGTAVFDPATGMFSPAAAWQCLRAEGNRAARLQRPLDVWIATAKASADIDAAGRQLAFDLPGSATAVRIGRRQLCVVSCAGIDDPDAGAEGSLEWTRRCVPAGGDTAEQALAFVSEVLDRA